MDIINSYCKPQQRADRWKVSENSKFSETYLNENGPGAISAQGSKNFFNIIRPMNGYEKSPSFMVLAQIVFGTDKKNTGEGRFPHQ